MFRLRAGALKPLLVTVTVVLAIGYLKLILNDIFRIESPILLFFGAIAVSAWYGGALQGLLAIALSMLFIMHYFVLPNQPVASNGAWTLRLILYFFDGFIISMVCSELRRSRSKLSVSESRLRQIFEANMIGLVFSDFNGQVVEANDYYLNLLGADRKDMEEGKVNWRDFTSPDSYEKSLEALRILRNGGQVPPFEKQYVRADKTQVSVLLGAARIDDQTYLGFVLDLSQSKMAERLSQSEQFLESVIEFIPNMIFVKDAKELRFLRFNRAGEELIGYPRSALMGKSDYDFFPKEQAEFFIAKDREVLENKVVVDIPEEPISTPNGIRYLHTKKIPLFNKDGEPEYLLGISEDISEKKVAEQQQIELLQAKLARGEAEKSAARLACLSAQATEASRAKSAFLANISHELRTPLGAMLGFAELALESKSPEAANQYVETILRNGKELLRIVDEILDISKAESNSMDIENVRFSLHHLLNDIHTLLDIRASQKNLTLKFEKSGDIPEYVLSDPFRIRQILLNIVGNAIKFTNDGSVTVETSFTDGVLQFLITDTGIGIDPAHTERLFTPFTQADDTTSRKFGGTGLGLFLSRRLAGLMGGDVRLLHSTPKKGSQFLVTIQVIAEPSASKAANNSIGSHKSEEAPPSHIADAKVLVVDDSLDNQDLIAAFLARSGIKSEMAHKGSEAIAMADESYGAILMDIQMPEMDGFEALRLLRQKGLKVPVIAVTAHAMKGDRERCLKSGFDDYLCKPLSRKTLEECLRRHLS